MLPKEGHVICVKELLEAAAELNAITKKGETALICSIRSGHTECVKELISAGANVNNRNSVGTVSPLISAVREESLLCVQELLEAGAEVNASDGVDTALMVACESGNRSMVRVLLENGADVNAESSDGMTALCMAVTQGHDEFRRVEFKKEDHEVNTRFSAHSSMVILLLKAGAHLKETSLRLNPCTVHLEPSYSHGSNFHILKTLSIAGANVGGTAILTLENNLKSLTRNCIREHLKRIDPETNLYIKVPCLPLPPLLQSYLLFNTLLKENTFISKDEEEFLYKTTERDVASVLNFIHSGINVNVQDENGMTALMLASQAGHVELIQELLKAGSSMNIQTCLETLP